MSLIIKQYNKLFDGLNAKVSECGTSADALRLVLVARD